MMKKIAVLIVAASLLLLAASVTMAQTFTAGEKGLLIGVDSSSYEIGGIFHVNDRFLINPSFSYSNQTLDVNQVKEKTTEYLIETGLYYNVTVSEKMSLFLGPKIGYLYRLAETTGSERKLDGMLIKGFLGVQYMFSDKFGIIGSVELQSMRLTGKQKSGDDTTDLTEEQTSTDQKLSVVFYF